MARYRATIQGARGRASRLGHRSLSADVNGWRIGISAEISPCEKCGEDQVTARVSRGSGYQTPAIKRSVRAEFSVCVKCDAAPVRRIASSPAVSEFASAVR